jgi:uncharacterized protein with GYD domain
MKRFTPGDHGSTLGTHPIAAAIGPAVPDTSIAERLVDHAATATRSSSQARLDPQSEHVASRWAFCTGELKRWRTSLHRLFRRTTRKTPLRELDQRRSYDCLEPGRTVMTTYVMLANWTEQGILKVKDSPRRLDVAKKALKDMGGEFKSYFLTMGDYDIVAIYEAPDDAVAARFNLQLGMLGNVRTRTLKAFPEAAYREIINSLG